MTRHEITLILKLIPMMTKMKKKYFSPANISTWDKPEEHLWVVRFLGMWPAGCIVCSAAINLLSILGVKFLVSMLIRTLC